MSQRSDQASESARVFVALALPSAVKDRIRMFQEELRRCLRQPSAFRWSDPGQVHLTVKFLGNVAVEDLPRVEAALQEAGRGLNPMTLQARDLGFFPSRRKPRVCWIGVEGDLKGLRALHESVDRLTEPWAPREGKPYAPHLTLARVKGADSRLGEDLAVLPEAMWRFQLGQWRADRMDFMRSQLRPQGAFHTRLESVILTGSI